MIDHFPLEANIKAERVRRSITQADMAQAVGVSLNSYRKIEAGKRQLKLNEFIVICRKLDKYPSSLISGS